jgi:hypothetical protein
LLKQFCCEVFPSCEDFKFPVIERNSRPMEIMTQVKVLVSPFFEKMGKLEKELQISPNSEIVQNLVSELNSKKLDLSSINSEITELEKEIIQKKVLPKFHLISQE